MSRIYGKRIETGIELNRYFITIDHPQYGETEFEVSEIVFQAIDDLQRELWRLEKRESRHCVHLEVIPDAYLPYKELDNDPEKLLMNKLTSEDINEALNQIPIKQRRRFLLRYSEDFSIKQIALLEGCSERAIKYSISLAKKNLADIIEAEI